MQAFSKPERIQMCKMPYILHRLHVAQFQLQLTLNGVKFLNWYWLICARCLRETVVAKIFSLNRGSIVIEGACVILVLHVMRTRMFVQSHCIWRVLTICQHISMAPSLPARADSTVLLLLRLAGLRNSRCREVAWYIIEVIVHECLGCASLMMLRRALQMSIAR